MITPTGLEDIAQISELIFIKQEDAQPGFQDIARISGLIFIKRGFLEKALESEENIRAECPFGDLSDDQLAIFKACIRHPRLREVIDMWWQRYDEARATGIVPQAIFWAP